MKMNFVLIRILILAVVGGTPATAYAYLDPSIIHQGFAIVVGAITSSLVMLRIFWTRFSIIFKRNNAKIKEDHEASSKGPKD